MINIDINSIKIISMNKFYMLFLSETWGGGVVSKLKNSIYTYSCIYLLTFSAFKLQISFLYIINFLGENVNH